MGMRCCHTRRTAIVALLAGLFFCSTVWAVTSKITRQSSGKDLLAGKSDNVVVSSRGTIQLGRAAKVLTSEFPDAWSINNIMVSGGTIYLGTSPNGSIYKYSLGKLTRLYPPEGESAAKPAPAASEPNAAAKAADSAKSEGEVIKADERFANQHIFAMAMDVAGRLLAGISGSPCKLCRYEGGKMETIFEPNDARYIFAIEVDTIGNIYVGTGPEGKIYVLDPSGKVAQLVYDSPDKNILSLAAGQDGMLYAGSDTRGLIYKVNPRSKTATVVYDSDEPEISSLLFLGGTSPEAGCLYATATSAKVTQAEAQFAAQPASAGRPEPKEEGGKTIAVDSEGGMRLKIANTSQESPGAAAPRLRPATRIVKPGTASYVYRINKQGYVEEVFSEAAVFFCLAKQDDRIFVGAGNDGQLFAVEPGSERQAIVYKDQQATQITAVTASDKDVYIGTANPAKLVLLSPGYATQGTYTSDLIDAGQPAKWGKIQIDAEIPRGCKVLVASRSGNVKDVNDPTFSEWTEMTEMTEPIQLRCPLGRFCQYKLALESQDSQKTPLIREIAVASTVPNLAPRVESIDVSRLQNPDKQGFFKIACKAGDENDDKLTYKIDFRKVGRTHWIEVEEKAEADSYEWDGKTVEDGRYEIRVVASDEKSNTPATRLTGSRISDPIVVDNTGPVIRKYSIDKSGKAATLKLQVTDELSVINKLEYTIDSNKQWKGTLPDDFVFDTTDESFTIVTEDLEPGEHVIALKISDDMGNTTCKTFELSVLGK